MAGEYAITPVDHVSYPNRLLRQAGLLAVREGPDGEDLDLENSRAFALVDHQFSHVFVADGDQALAARAAEVFRGQPGMAEVLLGSQRGRYGLEHPNSGDVILVSSLEAGRPIIGGFRTIGPPSSPGQSISTASRATIRWSCASMPAAGGIPLDAARIKGSHGTRR